MNYKISVIIPVYNASKYLNRLVESINKQDFEEFEVIFVNDGSTDNSANILSNLLKNKQHYQLINQVNAGAPAARNNGISHASGEYLYFCDADDELEVNGLSLLYNKAIENDADLVIGSYKEIDERTDLIKNFNIEKLVSPNDLDYKNVKQLFFIPPSPWNKMVKRELVMNHSLKFEDVRIGQDLYFYFSLLPKVKRVNFQKESVYKYYVNAGSISNSYDDRILNIVKTINLIKKIYQEQDIYNQYRDELQYVLNGHLITQIFKTPYIADQRLRSKVRKELIGQLNLKNIYQNQYYKKTPVYFIVLIFFKYPFLFNNVLTQLILRTILPIYNKKVL